MSDLVTKAHFDATVAAIRAEIANATLRQTIALGGIMAALCALVVLAAAL